MPNVPIYIVSAMLLLATLPMPYGYYTLLRLVACGFFAWAATISFERKILYLPWAFSILALLFNPVIKIHLPKELWTVIDIVSGIFILVVKSKIVEVINDSE